MIGGRRRPNGYGSCAGQALAVGHCQSDGVIAGLGEHVAGRGAGAGGAVAEVPMARGDAAGGRTGVEGYGERRRAVERCGGDRAGRVGCADRVDGGVREQVGQAAFRAVEEHGCSCRRSWFRRLGRLCR